MPSQVRGRPVLPRMPLVRSCCVAYHAQSAPHQTRPPRSRPSLHQVPEHHQKQEANPRGDRRCVPRPIYVRHKGRGASRGLHGDSLFCYAADAAFILAGCATRQQGHYSPLYQSQPQSGPQQRCGCSSVSLMPCLQPSGDRALASQVLHHVFPASDIVRVPIMCTAGTNTSRDISTWMADARFHTLPEVAVGARVMLTRNVNVCIGAVNGALGIVTNIHYGPPHKTYMYDGCPTQVIKSISIQLQHSGKVGRCGFRSQSVLCC